MLNACIARLTMRRCHNALGLIKDFAESKLMFLLLFFGIVFLCGFIAISHVIKQFFSKCGLDPISLPTAYVYHNYLIFPLD